jgi:hypothetical protein
MQAVAAGFSGDAGKPTPLFELQRVRKVGKGHAIVKRVRILLLFGWEPAMSDSTEPVEVSSLQSRHRGT